MEELDYQLTYTYANNGLSNKLMKVIDALGANRDYGFKDDSDGTNDIEDDYGYDTTYGNMTSDQNKGIQSIVYNHLNLPTIITFDQGTKIEYLYNAAGVKLAKTVLDPNPTTTAYLNGYQYVDNTLQFFPHAEGYVKFTEGNNNQEFFNYIYQYKDHLGNNRMSYTIDPSDNVLKILTEDHYYPFGMKHHGYSNSPRGLRSTGGIEFEGELYPLAPIMVMDDNDLAYKYKFNGFELQDELGFDIYDFGARNYDPAIGRWMNMDPLAENSRRWTPYNYAYNNPVYFIDPDGMQAVAGDDLFIKGHEAELAFEQLQASMEGQLELVMNDKGKVEATPVEGAILTEKASTILEATKSESVNVTIWSENIGRTFEPNAVPMSGGAFLGSEVQDGVVNAEQLVNPLTLGEIDNHLGQPYGTNMLHETLEAYLGGVYAPGAKPALTGDMKAIEVYTEIHNKAAKMDEQNYQNLPLTFKVIYSVSGKTTSFNITNNSGQTINVSKQFWPNKKR